MSSLCFSGSLVATAPDYCFVDHKHHVHFEGEYRHVGSAEFRTHTDGVKGTHLHYRDGSASVYLSHDLTEKNSLSWQLGYSYMKIDWKENPRFKEDEYNYGLASLAWISTSIDKWRWITNAGVSVNTHEMDFGKTAAGWGLFWGRCAFNDHMGAHVGVVGYGGMGNGYVLPILGLDWDNPKWKLKAIFPLDLSAEYLFNDYFSTALAYAGFGGPYRYPNRAHEGIGRFKEAIFSIYSSGLELDLKGRYKDWFKASIGAGWNFGGWLYIKDRHNHHAAYYKYKGAPYAQGNLSFSF